MRLSHGLVLASFLAAASSASASILDFTASSAHRQGTVRFEVDSMDASKLIVTLTNSAMTDVMVPVDVMTGVFWDVSGPSLVLTSVSAILNADSAVHFAPAPAGGVVGGEWGYGGSLAGGGPANTDYGISSSGLGLFGGPTFPGPDLDPPSALDGLNYGLTSAGDNMGTGNAQVTGGRPLIKSSVVFTFMGLPAGFNPAASINNIQFQYGTDLSEPHFPTPGAAGLLGIAGLFIGRRRR
jgi:MYXO-CTERM domain-containing protein